MATHIGTTGMIEQPARTGWSPSTGAYTIRVWRGPRHDAPLLGAQLRGGNYEYEIINEPGGLATVTARVASDETGQQDGNTITTVWERQVNTLEKSIFYHSTFASLLPAERKLVRQKFAAFESEDGNPDSVSFANAANKTLMDQIYLDLTLGVESFVLEQPVVRLTEIVAVRAALEVSRANTGKILTFEQMKTNELAPVVVLDNITTPAAYNGVARYGYRKGDPTVTQQAEGKWQVAIEWEAGFWANALYKDAS